MIGLQHNFSVDEVYLRRAVCGREDMPGTLFIENAVDHVTYSLEIMPLKLCMVSPIDKFQKRAGYTPKGRRSIDKRDPFIC
jgi:hypothetical protein